MIFFFFSQKTTPPFFFFFDSFISYNFMKSSHMSVYMVTGLFTYGVYNG